MDKGITLIALIITIIVILILAGVALSTLTGEGSIIKNAETAVGEYNNKVIEEQKILNKIMDELHGITEEEPDEPIIEGDITIIPSTMEWTNGVVEIKVIYPEGTESLIKEISLDGGLNWTEYVGKITVSENCTVMARIKDNSQIETKSLTISKIDKIGPTAPIITGGSTEWSISRTITVSEKAVETGSGIAYYEYYLSDSEVEPTMSSVTTGKVGNTENDISLLFDTDYNGYYVYFRAIDNVSNIGEWSKPQRLFIDINPAIVVGGSYSYYGDTEVTVMGELFSVDNNGNAPIKNIEISVQPSDILDIEPGYHETIYFPNIPATFTVVCNVTKENGLTTTEYATVLIARRTNGGGSSSRP